MLQRRLRRIIKITSLFGENCNNSTVEEEVVIEKKTITNDEMTL